MNKHIVRILFAALVVVLISRGAESAPKIKVEHTTWDLGEVDEGKTPAPTHTFRIVNEGTDTLRIDQNIIIDRPYITVVLDKYELEMDEAANLTVTFDTTGLGNRKIRAFIYLSSNDRDIAFTVMAEIKPKPVPILRVDPARRYFGEVERGDRKSAVFTCVNVGRGILTIKGIIYIDKEKQFRIVQDITQKELGPNEESNFKISFTAIRKGQHKKFLVIESNSGGEPTLTKVELEATVVTKIRGLILGSPTAPPPDRERPQEAPKYFTVNIENKDIFEIIATYNDGNDTVLVRPGGGRSIKLPLLRDETSDRIKLAIEYIVRKHPEKLVAPSSPPAQPARPAAPSPAAPIDTAVPTPKTLTDTE